MYKKVNVVMLPTNEKANIILDREILEYIPNAQIANTINSIVKGYHLYITSDDEIKEGDWVLVENGSSYITGKILSIIDTVAEVDVNWSTSQTKSLSFCKKIIATTDSSLKIHPMQMNSPHFDYLPELTQQFIEKYIEEYNKGNIITDVLVKTNYGENPYGHGGHNDLKVNPKDNTITIKRVKDSWTREFVLIK